MTGWGAGPSGPFDPGLQNERTSLAWRRTSLALLTAALIVARVVVDSAPALAVGLAAVAVPAALVTNRLSDARHAQAEHALRGGRHLPDGRLPALLTGVTLLIGAVEMAYLLAG